MSFESVVFFMDRFPDLKADKDEVQLEFLRYQMYCHVNVQMSLGI